MKEIWSKGREKDVLLLTPPKWVRTLAYGDPACGLIRFKEGNCPPAGKPRSVRCASSLA